MSEEWLPVVGFEGAYEVSGIGGVRSIDRMVNGRNGFLRPVRGRVLKPCVGKWGYKLVTISLKGRVYSRTVHRLVAAAFLGESELTVDHIDFDKLNNKVGNLEYVTQRENVCRYHRNKRQLPTGVYLSDSKKKYKSKIYKGGRLKHLGYYKTVKEAHEAYLGELKIIEGERR